MFTAFLLLHQSLSAGPVDTRVCLARTGFPPECANILRINCSSESINVTEEILTVKTRMMHLLLEDEQNFTIAGDVFRDAQVTFSSMGTKSQLALEYGGAMPTTSFTFERVDVEFVDPTFSGLEVIELGSLSFVNSTMAVQPQMTSISATEFTSTFSNAMLFRSMTLKNTLKLDKIMTNLEVDIGRNKLLVKHAHGQCTFSFANHGAEIELSGNRELKLTTNVSQLDQALKPKLHAFQTVTIHGTWPSDIAEEDLLSLETGDLNLVVEPSVVPLSIDCGGKLKITLSGATTFPGKVDAIEGTDLRVTGTPTERMEVVFTKKFTVRGKLSLFSDMIDVKMTDAHFHHPEAVQTPMPFPIVFGMGERGYATVVVSGSLTSDNYALSKVSEYEVKILLQKPFSRDDELVELLRPWKIFSCPYDALLDSSAQLKFSESDLSYFGFDQSRECILQIGVDVSEVGSSVWMKNTKNISRTAQKLSVGPLNRTGYVPVKAEDVEDLSRYFLDGMANLVLFLDVPVGTINLSRFSGYEHSSDVEVQIIHEGNSFELAINGDKKVTKVTLGPETGQVWNLGTSLTLEVPTVVLMRTTVANPTDLTVRATEVIVDEYSLASLTETTTEHLVVNFDEDPWAEVTVTLGRDSWVIDNDGDEATIEHEKVGRLTINRSGLDDDDAGLKLTVPDGVTNAKGFTQVSQTANCASLTGDWSGIQSIDPPVVFDHGRNQLTVTMTTLMVPSGIQFDGEGEVLLLEDLSESQVEYCVCTGSDCEDCTVADHVAADQVSSTLEAAAESLVTFSIITATKENPIALDISVLSAKHVIFKPVGEEITPYISISNNSPMPSPRWATCEFSHVHLSGPSSGELAFGSVVLDTCLLDDALKDIDLSVVSLTCSYSDLGAFRSVGISNDLTVSGDVSSVPTTTTFRNKGGNRNQIHAHFPGGDVIIGDKCLTIGNSIFSSLLSNQSRVGITVAGGGSIDISCAAGVAEDDLPAISVLTESDGHIDVKGSWPNVARGWLVNLTCQGTSSRLKITGQNVPVTIWHPSDLTIEAQSAACGISGDVYLDEDALAYGKDAIAMDQSLALPGRACFTFGGTLYFSSPDSWSAGDYKIVGLSPALATVFTRMVGAAYGPSRFVFAHTLGLEGASSFTIRSILENARFSGDQNHPFTIVSRVTGKHTDSELSEIVDKNVVLVKAKAIDIVGQMKSFKLEYADDPIGATHGFSKYNRLHTMVINEQLTTIMLRASMKASELPMTIAYRPKKSVSVVQEQEYEIYASDPTSAQIASNLSTVLPPTVKRIEIYTYANISGEYPLRFDNLGELTDLDVRIFGERKRYATDQFIVFATFSNAVSNLTLDFIHLAGVEGAVVDLFTANVTLHDVVFEEGALTSQSLSHVTGFSPDLATLVNISDLPSALTCPVNILKVSDVVFLADGWNCTYRFTPTYGDGVYINYIVSALKCPNTVIHLFDVFIWGTTRGENALDVNDNHVTTIRKTEVRLHGNYSYGKDIGIRFYGSWYLVTNRDALTVIVDDDITVVNVLSRIYPMPKIEHHPTTKIQLNFTRGLQDIVLSDGYVFDNQILDLNLEAAEQQTVTGQEVFFKGTSSISFQGKGTLVAVDIIATDGSTSSLAKAQVSSGITLQGDSDLSGSFEFQGAANLTYLWDLNKVPVLTLHGTTSNGPTPTNIIFRYNGTTTDPDEINKLMFLKTYKLASARTGTFDCETWKNALSFESDLPIFAANGGLEARCYDNWLNIVTTKTAPWTPTSQYEPSTGGTTMEQPTSELQSVTITMPSPETGTVTTTLTTTDEGHGDKTNYGLVVGVPIACVVVVAIIVVVVIVVVRRRGMAQLNHQPLTA